MSRPGPLSPPPDSEPQHVETLEALLVPEDMEAPSHIWVLARDQGLPLYTPTGIQTMSVELAHEPEGDVEMTVDGERVARLPNPAVRTQINMAIPEPAPMFGAEGRITLPEMNLEIFLYVRVSDLPPDLKERVKAHLRGERVH